MEEQIGALEANDMFTGLHTQSVMRISKMLKTMCSEFQAYHYKIVAGLESNKEATHEQVVFDEHQRMVMEFTDHLGDFLAKPQLSDPFPLTTNNRLVNRHLDFLEDSVQTIRRGVEKPDIVDTRVDKLLR